ncbi:HLA class II histocompatibility antigen, DQ beta 1 chain-like [Pantherophis guttatus]|uniref:HLA class II histocompatibility antigen, DQ beta 1 chain-like n=1 Tax=Pantherophis guttatus TaxID=94885 RepID=A0ABM3Z605_PANGU|nr:HLA class II histocompatibility antigen, DQ beta 1 chain-like [Pantherophis guttatus]
MLFSLVKPRDPCGNSPVKGAGESIPAGLGGIPADPLCLFRHGLSVESFPGFPSDWDFYTTLLPKDSAVYSHIKMHKFTRYLERGIYDWQEIYYFDSDCGEFVAVTPLGQPYMDKWNRDKQCLQYKKAEVDGFCRYNYRLLNYEAAKAEEHLIGRRGEHLE